MKFLNLLSLKLIDIELFFVCSPLIKVEFYV